MKELKGLDAMLALTDLPDDVILDACPLPAVVSASPRRRARVCRAVLLCAALTLLVAILVTSVILGGKEAANKFPDDNPDGDSESDTQVGNVSGAEPDGERLPAGLETWFEGEELFGNYDPNYDFSDGAWDVEGGSAAESDVASPPVDGVEPEEGTGNNYWQGTMDDATENEPLYPEYDISYSEIAENAALVPKPEVSVVALSGNRYVRAYQYGRWLMDGTTQTNHTRTDSLLDLLKNGYIGTLDIPVLTSSGGEVYNLCDESFTLVGYRVYDKRGNAVTPNASGTYFVILEMNYVALNGLRCGGEYGFWLELVRSANALNITNTTSIPEHLITTPSTGKGDETTPVWNTETVTETETMISIEWGTEKATETETSDYPDMSADAFLIAAVNGHDHIASMIQPELVESSTYQGALAFCERNVPAIIYHGHCEEPMLSTLYGKLRLFLPKEAEVQQLTVYNAAGEVCTPDMPDSYYVSIMLKRGDTGVYECYVFRLKVIQNIDRLLYTVYEGDDQASGRDYEYIPPTADAATPSTGTDYDEKESLDVPLPDADA